MTFHAAILGVEKAVAWAKGAPTFVGHSREIGSGIVTRGKFAKNWEKSEKSRKEREQIREKEENREGSFTLPILAGRAGYATGNWKVPWKKKSPKSITNLHIV